MKESLERDITKKLGLRGFAQGYGMTEALSSMTKTKNHSRNKLGSCGSVMPGIEVKVGNNMTKQNEIHDLLDEICDLPYRDLVIIGY